MLMLRHNLTCPYSPASRTRAAVSPIILCTVASDQTSFRSCAQRVAAAPLKRGSAHMRLQRGGWRAGLCFRVRKRFKPENGEANSPRACPFLLRCHITCWPSAKGAHRYQRLSPSVGSTWQRSGSAQIIKRQPSGEMADPPDWPAEQGMSGVTRTGG